jgi:phosphonate transport system substrate-binding protein
MKKTARLIFPLAALLSLFCPLVAGAGHELTLLIHPYQTPTEIHKKFSPLADYLGKETGKRIVIKVAKGYEQQIDAVGKDEMDLAYMGPNEYVTMVHKYGKKPLLACQEINGKPFLYGMIIVKRDSPLTNLAELAGKRIAFVSPESTMYVVPRMMLQEAGVDLKQVAQADFLKSHSNVALAVLNGYYDAGAVKDEAFYTYQERGLKALAQTPPIHEHLFVTSSHLPESMIASLRKALQDLHDPAVLTAIQPALTGLIAVEDSDYDTLRQTLGIVQ